MYSILVKQVMRIKNLELRWACSSCRGSVDRLRRRWLAHLYHVCDQHEWICGRCFHGPLVEPRPQGRQWLSKQSKAYKTLVYVGPLPIKLIS